MRFNLYVLKLILTITTVNCFALNSLNFGSNEDISPVIYVNDDGDQRVIFIVSKITQWIQNNKNVKEYDTQSTMKIETRFGGEDNQTENVDKEINTQNDPHNKNNVEGNNDIRVDQERITETGTKDDEANNDNKMEDEVTVDTGNNLENGTNDEEEDSAENNADNDDEVNDNNSEKNMNADEEDENDDVIVDFGDEADSSNKMQIQIMKNILQNQHNLAMKQNRRRSVVSQLHKKEEIMSYNLYRNIKQRGETKRKRVRVVVSKRLF